MKKFWSNYVFNFPRKFSNIGHNSRFYSWKLSRSSLECLDHISSKKWTWELPRTVKVELVMETEIV